MENNKILKSIDVKVLILSIIIFIITIILTRAWVTLPSMITYILNDTYAISRVMLTYLPGVILLIFSISMIIFRFSILVSVIMLITYISYFIYGILFRVLNYNQIPFAIYLIPIGLGLIVYCLVLNIKRRKYLSK